MVFDLNEDLETDGNRGDLYDNNKRVSCIEISFCLRDMFEMCILLLISPHSMYQSHFIVCKLL